MDIGATFYVEDNHAFGAQTRQKWVTIPLGGSVTFGRDSKCDLVLRPVNRQFAVDAAVSRVAGELRALPPRTSAELATSEVELWNHSTTGWITVAGNRGYTMNVPPGTRAVLTQERTWFWIEGAIANYGALVNIPEDETAQKSRLVELHKQLGPSADVPLQTEIAKAAASLKNNFAPHHRLILEEMFRDYLDPRPGVYPRPRPPSGVYEALKNHPLITSCYPADSFTNNTVLNVVNRAIQTARDHQVPGMDEADNDGATWAGQVEWRRHRLGLFLLGSGVLEVDRLID